MISLDNVVEVFHLSVVCFGGTFALFLQLANGVAVASRLVRVDHAGLLPFLASAQRLAQEPLGGVGIAGLRQVEVDGVATAVDRALQIRPFPFDLDVRFVHAPRWRKAATATMPAQAPFDFRRVGLHPAIDGGVVHRNAALFQQFLEVTVADAVSAVPSDGPQNDLAPEMPPLEVMGQGRVSKCTAYQSLPSNAASLTRTAESKFFQQGRMKAGAARGKHLGRPPLAPGLVKEIKVLAPSTNLSIREIHKKIGKRASRGRVGEITKQIRSVAR